MSHQPYNPNRQYSHSEYSNEYEYQPEDEDLYEEGPYQRQYGDEPPLDLPEMHNYDPRAGASDPFNDRHQQQQQYRQRYDEYDDSIPMQPLSASTSRRTDMEDDHDLGEEHMLDEDTGDQPLLAEEEEAPRVYRIPEHVPRRFKTVKNNPLYHGNFVLDKHPLPSDLIKIHPQPDTKEDEFNTLRYTMATCDPNDFVKDRYTLRQKLGSSFKDGRPRSTELFVVLTMYNEDDHLLARTLFGVFEGLEHLQTRKNTRCWGEHGWKNVVICIVSDGRAKVHRGALALLAALGVYQDGVAIDHGEGVESGSQRPATCHIYENTTRMKVAKVEKGELKVVPGDSSLLPGVQMIFALKEQNAKKINSHRWFFNAFSEVLEPNVTILLDVGTRPTAQSLYRLWKTFEDYPYVGGCCGEIVAQKDTWFKNLLNPIIATQNFEYKISNILDKPLESVFGYITVLPGAFSAYRYRALQNDAQGKGPLCEYFKGEDIHKKTGGNLFTKVGLFFFVDCLNMLTSLSTRRSVPFLLLSDEHCDLTLPPCDHRILCWELVSKRGSRWTLHYQRSAQGITDVMSNVTDLIAQRRRWLNGSFFASLNGILHFGYIYRSEHTFGKKFWLHIELVYQVYQTIFSWFALGNFYIIFIVLISSLKTSGALKNTADSKSALYRVTEVLNPIFKYWYLAMLILCYLLSLGNKPKASPRIYLGVVISYAIITVYMLFAAMYITVDGIYNETHSGDFNWKSLFTDNLFRNIVISMVSTWGLYFFASCLFGQPWHMFTSFIQYLLLSASYINVIQVYSFSNIQDVSWGNRPEEHVAPRLGGAKAAADGTFATKMLVDSNKTYEHAKNVLAGLDPEPPHIPTQREIEKKAEEQQDADYATLRTNVVLLWTLSNAALATAILSTSAGQDFITQGDDKKVNVYMIFLLYSVAGLAFIRALGAIIYTITWLRHYKR